jgi:hypothetical protein
MTSTIKVNNVQNQCGTNIIKRCGTTTTVGSGASNPIVVCGSSVTIGRCGGTVALASGATQSGFGRTGTVDWQTGSIKTSDFTLVNGQGFFVDTNGGAVIATLPTGSAGSIISIQDYRNTFDTNNCTVQTAGSQKINGGTAGGKVILSTEGEGITLVYIDSTIGWRSIQDNTFASPSIIPTLITATGGNAVLTNGDFKTHIFTGPGTFCVSAGGGGLNIADYLVVAGGGGGATPTSYGGGGGAGGFRIANSQGCIPAPTMSPLVAPNGITLPPGPYSIVVGGGGAAGAPVGTSGSVSTFSTITSAGGGGGAKCGAQGGSGGSGGGGSGGNPQPSEPNTKQGGVGNTPPVSPPQGNDGGAGNPGPQAPTGGEGGGGGGAGAAGSDAPGPNAAGPGGAGSFLADSFIGPTAPSYGTSGPVSSTRYFAGGGGGGTDSSGTSRGSGGDGGGGQGAPSSAAGTTNTGGGGGGSSHSGNPPNTGSAGGSGIVMIRYKFQ